MGNVPYNRPAADLSLRDLLDLHKKEILLSFNCHALATVQEFDPITQTVTASLNYPKTFQERQSDGTYKQVLVEYPLVTNAPVVIIQGGLAALTFPIQAGDSCVILFNDRDMDNWITAGQVSPLNSNRLHAFADGIALVGLNSFVDTFEDYDTERAVLKNDQAMVGVGPIKVKVANDLTSLGSALDQLMTTLSTLLTAMSAATPANVVATIAVPSAAAAAQIQIIKLLLQGLLE